MASVRVIAEEAGVSIATVSRVLNNDPAVKGRTRAAVLSVANRVGYLRHREREIPHSIAFTYTQDRTLAHPFDAAVLEGAVRGAERARIDVMVLSLQRDKRQEESYTEYFRRKSVRGVVLRTAAATRDICRAIADEGFPHVVISDRFEESNVNFIDGDSKSESRRAVEFLISLGHQRIAFGMHNVPDRDHFDRFEAYREALEHAGLAFDERLVFRQPATLAGGATIMTVLLSNPQRASAIFLADPALAVGAVNKAHELGARIPDDLSVVGFDDTDMRFGVHPTLSAVCQDAEVLGFEAARWLSGDEQALGLRKIVPTYLEINGSTGAVPGGLGGPAKVKGNKA